MDSNALFAGQDEFINAAFTMTGSAAGVSETLAESGKHGVRD